MKPLLFSLSCITAINCMEPDTQKKTLMERINLAMNSPLKVRSEGELANFYAEAKNDYKQYVSIRATDAKQKNILRQST